MFLGGFEGLGFGLGFGGVDFFSNFSIGTVKEIINFGLIMRLNLIFLQVLCLKLP